MAAGNKRFLDLADDFEFSYAIGGASQFRELLADILLLLAVCLLIRVGQGGIALFAMFVSYGELQFVSLNGEQHVELHLAFC